MGVLLRLKTAAAGKEHPCDAPGRAGERRASKRMGKLGGIRRTNSSCAGPWRRSRQRQRKEEQPMRVAFYVRVSTERQQHAQTIEQQLTQLWAYVAAQEGWAVGE